MNYHVRGWAYRVASVYENFTDDGWYEYRVQLWDADYDELIDEWDSLLTAPVERLTHEQAVAAVQNITADVHDGNPEKWFTLP